MEKSFAQALCGKSPQLGTLRCLSCDGSYVEMMSSFVPRIEAGVTDILWLIHGAAPDGALHWTSDSSTVNPLPDNRPSRIPNADFEQMSFSGLLQTLLANTPVGVALLDEALKFVCLNQSFARMTGLMPDRQLGLPLMEVMPQLGNLIEPHLKKVLRNGNQITDCEIALHTFSLTDSSRWGLLSFYPLLDAAGGACGVAISAVDITDRKRAEKALRESEDRFRLAVEATKLGTWDLSYQTRKVVWSDRTRAIFGVGPNTPIDHRFFLSKIHHDDFERVCQAVAAAQVRGSGGEYQVEYRIRTERDEEERWIADRGKVFFDAKGAPYRFVGTTLDITAQKKVEEALRTLSDELRRSNNALDAFAYTASHDLKEPLRMISSFVKLLSTRYKDKLDGEAKEYIGYIVNGAARMGRLIDSVLQYARAGRATFESVKVDTGAVLDVCLRNLGISLAEANVELTHENMPVVCGSETLILQVFQNLIANAIKFRSKQKPKIHIGATPQGDRWLFSVCDNGIGISPEFIEAIFSPFRRLHSQTAYSGSGLGLAICRQNIERLGGRIWATSEKGKGSNFYFTLLSVGGGKS